jgi:tetraacyldisaccharide 4'-kinase
LLDLLYAQAVGARRRWYERHPQTRRRLSRPVISVGNLSVGGTAKTPMASLIARWLMDVGERPSILSRGYARRDRLDGVVVVSDGTRVLADVNRAGDEPLMLARTVQGAIVAVSDDRYLAGVLAERHFGATVHVLDDGFQHVQLSRDLDVLMTTPGEVSGGRVLPYGRLREGASAAARADLVVVLETDMGGARAEAWTLGISQAVGARRRLSKARDRSAVVAVAGVAHPGRFFQTLRESDYNLAATIAFPDHHRYRVADVARVGAAVSAAGAERVVTTEKDFVRWEALAPLPFTCEAVAMTLDIDGWDVLTASIEQAMVRAREVA